MRIDAVCIGLATLVATTTLAAAARAQDATSISGGCNYPVSFTNQGTGARPGPATLVPLLWGQAPSDDVTEAEAQYDGVYSVLAQSNYYRWLQIEYGAPQLDHVYPASTVAPGELGPGGINNSDIENDLSNWVRSGGTPNVDNPIYVIHLPPGVTVNGSICSTALAYNGVFQTFNLFSGGFIGFYYIVVPAPGTCGLDFNGVTRVLSHEIAESVTDGAYFNDTGAHLHGWEDPAQPSSCGQQVGDLCANQQTIIQSAAERFDPALGETHQLTVQKLWSNQVGACVTEDLSTLPSVTSISTPTMVTYNGANVGTGGPGTVVTLNGTNLEGTPSVLFGSTLAIASCLSSTQCTVSAPPGISGWQVLTFSENDDSIVIGNFDYDPAAPSCTMTTECGGTVNASCTGPNVWIVPEGQVAELTVSPSTSTSASSRWIGSATATNTAEACTTGDDIASTCVQLSAPPPSGCGGGSEPPPRCNSGYEWCARYDACVLPKECLVQPPKP